MSSALTRELEGSLYLPVPLDAPDVEAAMEFLDWIVPRTVFSSGSGRRRRRGELRPAGQRSDQGYLVFYRRPDLDAEPQLTPMKSPASIRGYLQAQAGAPLADHWVATQITQFRARKDGRGLKTGFTAGSARHMLGIVVDLDGSRMAPGYRQLLAADWWAFKAAVDERLEALGVDMRLMVRSGPEGVHLYVPLIRPDGRPYRATEGNLAAWERAARGICRHFMELGADENAVRPTQPFVVPGVPRLKHEGFVPYVASRQGGARANLFALIRRLSELKLMPAARRPAPFAVRTAGVVSDLGSLLEEVRERTAGLSDGDGRNKAAHDLAVMLLCKGATPEQAWDTLEAWNKRNDPPLAEREFRGCLRSAERCQSRNPRKWAEMQAVPWQGLREWLGLPPARPAGYMAGGRWRPITPAKSWEQRKTSGGREHFEEVEVRVLRYVAGEGTRAELTQQELADIIDSNRSTVKAILERLAASGRLVVTTKRGRGGKTILALPEVGMASVPSPVENEPPSTLEAPSSLIPILERTSAQPQNGQSGLSSVAAKPGERVGSTSFPVENFSKKKEKQAGGQALPDPKKASSPQVAVSAPADPVALAAEILCSRWVKGPVDLDWVAMWEGRRRLVLTSREDDDPLLGLFGDMDLTEELSRRLGGVQVEVRLRRWKASADMLEWLSERDEGEDDDPEDDPPW